MTEALHKSAGNCGFRHIYWRILNGKLHFLCRKELLLKHLTQRRIQNPVNHLRWSFLGKLLKSKIANYSGKNNSILDVWHCSEYTCEGLS